MGVSVTFGSRNDRVGITGMATNGAIPTTGGADGPAANATTPAGEGRSPSDGGFWSARQAKEGEPLGPRRPVRPGRSRMPSLWLRTRSGFGVGRAPSVRSESRADRIRHRPGTTRVGPEGSAAHSLCRATLVFPAARCRAPGGARLIQPDQAVQIRQTSAAGWRDFRRLQARMARNSGLKGPAFSGTWASAGMLICDQVRWK